MPLLQNAGVRLALALALPLVIVVSEAVFIAHALGLLQLGGDPQVASSVSAGDAEPSLRISRKTLTPHAA